MTDANRLLSEQLQFVDSVGNPGIQLADMAASIVRRALDNRLQQPGWEDFGKLLVEPLRKDESRFLSFSTVAQQMDAHAA